MIAIVIKRTLADRELSNIKSLTGTNTCCIFSSISLPDELSQLNKGIYEIPEEIKKKINYRSMDFVISFGDKEFKGRSVVDWLKFDDSSIWYYHKFRAYFRFRNLKYETAEIQKLSGEYEKVIYYANDPLLAESRVPNNVVISNPENQTNKKQNISSLLSYGMIVASRSIINFFSSGKIKYPQHIIMDVSKRQVCLDINTLEEKKANYLIGYVIEKAGKNFLIIDEAMQPKMTDGAKISLNSDHLFGKGSMKGRYFGESILLKYFLSPNLQKRKKELINEVYNGLSGLEELCDGDNKLLIKIYRSFRGATNYYLIKYLAYRNFFEKHSFKTISTIDENSPALRSILDAARATGMKTIAIQHGNIYDLHPSYLYTKKDNIAHAMPDLTILWGKYYEDFLIQKANYPLDALMIAGQARTDVIPVLKNSEKAKQKKIDKIPAGHHIITFASQPQRDEQLRKQAALDVMNAVKDIPGSWLVIKLHPNELKDIGYYEDIARESGIQNYIISYYIDLYQLISMSTVLITCFSTVGSEAVYFGKPLIILDYQRQDLLKYIELGVAFPAYDQEGLSNKITGIIQHNIKIDTKAYHEFVHQFAYKIDGKVSERILDAIRNMK